MSYDNTFLILGGYSSSAGSYDTVYEWDFRGQQWLLKDNRLEEPKHALAVTNIADELC